MNRYSMTLKTNYKEDAEGNWCRYDEVQQRIAELEWLVTDAVTTLKSAVDVLNFIEVFVKSGERIKRPEGEEVFDAVRADLKLAIRALEDE